MHLIVVLIIVEWVSEWRDIWPSSVPCSRVSQLYIHPPTPPHLQILPDLKLELATFRLQVRLANQYVTTFPQLSGTEHHNLQLFIFLNLEPPLSILLHPPIPSSQNQPVKWRNASYRIGFTTNCLGRFAPLTWCCAKCSLIQCRQRTQINHSIADTVKWANSIHNVLSEVQSRFSLSLFI